MVQTDNPKPTRHPRKCTARSSRTKQPCKRWAMRSQSVCRSHGGGSPQAKAKAAAALEVAEARLRGLASPAVATLERLLVADSETVRLGTWWIVRWGRPANGSKWPLRSWCGVRGEKSWSVTTFIVKDAPNRAHFLIYGMNRLS